MEAEVSYCGLRSIISWIQEREASHGQQCHPADDIRLAHESITPSSLLQMRRQQALGSLQCLVRTSDDQWALIVSINLRFPLIEDEEVSRARLVLAVLEQRRCGGAGSIWGTVAEAKGRIIIKL